jgi:hypothetical protein
VTKGWDLDDWIILILVTGALIAATVYMFKHADVAVFVAWCGLVPTITGVYHWLTIRDDKTPDSGEGK